MSITGSDHTTATVPYISIPGAPHGNGTSVKSDTSSMFSMDMSGSKNVLAAFHAAKVNMAPVIKTKKNAAYGPNSKYADLQSVFDAIDDAVNNAGLVIIQPYRYEIVDGRPVLMLYTCVAHAESGEALVSFAPLIVPNLAEAQKLGSYMTYLRRYMLLAMFGLAPEDDDGNAASGMTTTVSKSPAPAPIGPNKAALQAMLRTKGAQKKADVTAILKKVGIEKTFDTISEDEAPAITSKLANVSDF